MKHLIQLFLVLTLIGATKISLALPPLDRMDQTKRDSTLLATAKQAIMTYGPGYYRDYKQTIERKQVHDQEDGTIDTYLITYYYDQNKELLEYNFAAKVTIKVKTGLVSSITFGNGRGFSRLDRKKTRSTNNTLIIPYQAVNTTKNLH